VLSGGKDYQMAWMLIYNTDFLDALTGGDVFGHHRNPTTTTTTTSHSRSTAQPVNRMEIKSFGYGDVPVFVGVNHGGDMVMMTVSLATVGEPVSDMVNFPLCALPSAMVWPLRFPSRFSLMTLKACRDSASCSLKHQEAPKCPWRGIA
jgi:hypothetical protein